MLFEDYERHSEVKTEVNWILRELSNESDEELQRFRMNVELYRVYKEKFVRGCYR